LRLFFSVFFFKIILDILKAYDILQLDVHLIDKHLNKEKSGGEIMLKISEFSKTYAGGKRAVDHLNLEVRSGEILGFIGHNGAGKTTTLRAVAGILDFTEGEITIDGHSIQKEPVEAKKVMAFLPDNPDIYEFLTGIKYLNFLGDLYEIPAKVREERIKTYADAFEITGVLGSAIGGYSHGMKQKLSLVSAFMRKPKLLILDEPFVGLDPQASFLLKGFLHEMCEAGGAVFFSTHVLEVAEKLCDRIAIIKQGKLIKVDTTASIVGDENLEQVFLELEKEDVPHA
jgi:ABC-2 type transport system ATP-binding protein